MRVESGLGHHALRSKLIAAMHSGDVDGHSGIPVTYCQMKQHFTWTGMKADVHDFVTACQIYQQAEPDRSKLPGLLQTSSKACRCLKGITAFWW